VYLSLNIYLLVSPQVLKFLVPTVLSLRAACTTSTKPSDVGKQNANPSLNQPERYAISYVPSELRGSEKAAAAAGNLRVTKYITNRKLMTLLDRYIPLLAVFFRYRGV